MLRLKIWALSIWIAVLPLSVVLPTVFLASSLPSVASACRDCPFPMKIGEGRWLMPNNLIEIHIEKIQHYSAFTHLYISLIDHETGDVLAIGSVFHPVAKSTIHANLYDQLGQVVTLTFQYTDPKEDEVEIQLDCSTCMIKSRLN